jgi:hypothetical protein
MGVYDRESIEVIRKLNPDITDINLLEIGQVIRFPRAYARSGPHAAGEATSATNKYGFTSHPE